MKRRLICSVLTLVLVLSVCSSALAFTIMQASGQCAINNSGRNVTYAGFSSSAKNEDEISVTLRLMEYRSGGWYEVDRAYKSLTNANYVSTSGNKTVVGGYYYKVIGIHYSRTGSQPYSVQSETAAVWIP